MRDDERLIQELEQENSGLKDEVERLKALASGVNPVGHKLPGVIELFPLPYQALDEDGRIITVNEAWLRVMGHTLDDVSGSFFTDFLDERSKQDFTSCFSEFKVEGEVHDAILTLVRKSGTTFPASVDGRIERDEAGRFMQTHCLLHDLTSRHKHEASLVRSESAMRTLLDASSENVVLFSPSGRIVKANAAFGRLYGTSPEELVGTNVYDLFNDEVAKRRRGYLREVLDAKRTMHHQDENMGRMFQASHTPIFGPTGEVELVAVFSRDITDAHQRERDLRDSERQYELLTENMADVIWTMTPDLKRTYTSPSVMGLRGFTPEEAQGQSLDESMTPESVQRIRKELARQEERRRASPDKETDLTTLELELYRKDGSTVWTEVVIKTLYDDNDEKTDYIGVTRDITARVKAREAQNRSEAKFRRMIEEIKLIGISLAPDGTIIFANDHFLSLTGWTREEILGRDWVETFIPEEEHEAGRALLRATLDPHAPDKQSTTEEDIITRDGDRLTVGWTNVLSTDADGNVMDLSCIGQDLTERRRTMAALKESEDRFRSIVEGTPMGVHIYELRDDDSLVIIGSNSAADKHVGGDSSRFIGRDLVDLFPALETTDIPKRARRIAREGGNWHIPRKQFPGTPDSDWFEAYAFQTSPMRMAVMFTNVTKQVEAEQALMQSERIYRRLFENSAVGILLADAQGVIQDANELASELLGYERREIRTLTPRDILHPEDARALPPEETRRMTRESDGVFNVERRYRKKNGDYLPVEVHIKNLDDQGNHLIMFHDISPRKKAERTLTDFRLLMEAMSDNMVDMLWAKDTEGHYFFANRAIRENLLCSDDVEVLGKTDVFFALRQREMGNRHTFGELCFNSDEVVLESKEPGRFVEDGLVRGEYLCLEVFKSPLYDETGKLIGTVGTGRDITAQKAADEELRRSRKLLEETQRLGGLGGFEMDVETREIFWTKGEYNTYGRDPSLSAPTIKEFLDTYVHPDDRKQMRNDWRMTAARKMTIENEFRAIHADGVTRILRYILVPELGEDGKTTRILGATRDVTEERAAERALRAAKEDAERASRSKGEFLANMSHELRTPLNGIFGMLQLAQITDLDEEQREYVETALATGRSLLTIINDVLDFSKLDAGVLDIARDPFDLRRTVTMVVDNFRVPTQEKGIEIRTSIGEGVPESLLGDDARLRQILFNLVGNAVKFCLEGHVSVSIHPLPVFTERKLRLLFTVSDTGIGIPEEYLDSIFEAFTQVDGAYTRKYSGTGLGLGIVKRLVKLLGGSLAIDSTPGLGTSVHFVLPFLLDSEDTVPGAGFTAPACSFSRPLRLLLAEDETVNQLAARIILEKQGHDVTCVSNGRDAVQAVADNEFDCVLMDIQMPEMDGVTATTAIRTIRPDLPIVAMTAHAMKGDRDRFLKAGMNAYVAKPVDVVELAETLAGLGIEKPEE